MGKKKTGAKSSETSVPSGPVHFQARHSETGIVQTSELAEVIIKMNTAEVAGRRRSPTESTDRGGKCRSNHGHGHV